MTLRKLNPADFVLSDDARRILETPVPGGALPLIDDIYSIRTSRREWFVVYTNPKCEERAATGFMAKGLASYVPKSTSWRRQSRREIHQKKPKERISRPLLTRYVFVELPVIRGDQIPFGAIRAIDGVREIVGTSDGPLVLARDLVEDIKQREGSGEFDDTVRYGRRTIAPKWATLGAAAQLKEGPFAGFMAVIEEILPNERVRLGVHIFGHMTPVEVGLDKIEKG